MTTLATCGACGHGWQSEPVVGVLVCPRCGATWDPKTGKVTKGRHSLRSDNYKIRRP